MRVMGTEEWQAFLAEGARTGKVGVTRRDGRAHVTPVWFVLDGEEVVFTSGARTVKARAIARTGRAAMCVDDERPPFSFASIEGPVVRTSTDLDEMLVRATRIGGRYMGAADAEEFGRRNPVEGELLVRLRAEHVTAWADLTD
jgi:PPOX class probable F420-dependent enzyme